MELEKIQKSYQRKQKLYHTKEKTLNTQIENAREVLEALKNSGSKLTYPHHHKNYLEPIAKELIKVFKNRTWKILGPFGLNCESAIHLTKKGVTGEKRFEDNNLLSVDFRLSSDKNGNNILVLVNRLKDSGRYPKGSIGQMNGCNYEEVEMPKTIEDLVKFIKKQNRKPRKKK